MNINHQKFKLSNSGNSSAIKKQSDTQFYSTECKCNCSFKINLLSEQISKINEKIGIVVRLMQIPCLQMDKNFAVSHLDDQIQFNQTKNEQQKNYEEQSLLLQGIEINESEIPDGKESSKNSNIKSNLLVGKEIGQLKSKISELQEKWEQVSKLRKNFSLLTKIVQKIGSKMEIQSPSQKSRAEHETALRNCSFGVEDQLSRAHKIAEGRISLKQEKPTKEKTPQQVQELRLGKLKGGRMEYSGKE